jgi:short-subunit dehydrogenase
MDKRISPWAVVTGASSGLGAALAADLAGRRINLVLAARREAPMQQLASRLREAHGIEVQVVAIDLAQPGSARALQARLDERGIRVDILINNAAFGLSGAFLEQDEARLNEMIRLDITAVTELAQVFGQRMAARGQGRMLLVASMAAYQPTPMLAVYGAAKAYVLSLGVSLHAELGGRNVGVTVLSPGLMDTGFAAAADYRAPKSAARAMLAPAKVARIGLDAMFAGKSSVIAGRINKISAFLTRLMSRRLQAQLVLKMAAS